MGTGTTLQPLGSELTGASLNGNVVVSMASGGDVGIVGRSVTHLWTKKYLCGSIQTGYIQ